jgi:hypothetical protein
VDYTVKSGDLLIDKAYINKSLSKFGSTSSASTPEAEIIDLYVQYSKLTETTKETLEGYNAVKSGRTLLQVSGIQITETLPELLYYVVSMVLASCAACGLVLVNELKKYRIKNESR